MARLIRLLAQSAVVLSRPHQFTPYRNNPFTTRRTVRTVTETPSPPAEPPVPFAEPFVPPRPFPDG